ncbi:MAG: alpha-E domain-containing protein [Lewinella sp.]|jgi:uncharacterized alpha-E superfamily protein|uniref:alpha-E domain-containing protein n=1 Tax=Lewinella sp. TaxID=2004506 RepID=UPI003D6B8446
MLNRVANTIYWMNRYIERAENYARFLDVNFNLALEMPPSVAEQWQPLIVATGDWQAYTDRYGGVEKNQVIYFLGFDPENPNSIFTCISNARENARSVRSEITKEVWEQINYLYYFVKKGNEKERWKKKDPRKFFRKIKDGCQLLYGMYDATISRNEGWHFAKMGRLVERADKTSRILDVKYHFIVSSSQILGSPLDMVQWVALLKSVTAYDMYRKTNGRLTPMGIAAYLLLDPEFPRSMYKCLIQAERSLQSITGDVEHPATAELTRMRIAMEQTNVEDIFAGGLHEYIDQFQQNLNRASSLIFTSFGAVNTIIQETSSQNQ